MMRCDLNAVSLGCIALGPIHTYSSGNTESTVDYILADVRATSLLFACHTVPMDDLNTSDHLPLFADLSFTSPNEENVESRNQTFLKIEWDQARNSGALHAYQIQLKAV